VHASPRCRWRTDDPEPSDPPGTDPGEPNENPPEEPPENGAVPRPPHSFRGDPRFDLDDLTPTQRAHYTKLLDELTDTNNQKAILEYAASDDVFVYGRRVHGYIQSTLTAYRMTGDLRLLDHVDTITERMRAELEDGWRDTIDGTDGTSDGYLNWVWRNDENDASRMGKDVGRQIDEMRTHALIAMIAYAFEQNRDLESPSGVDYGERADFWTDYLVNHFEAKWRERRNKQTGFPIMQHPGVSTYYAWTKWHYYMAKITGDDAYLNEANRMARELRNGIRTVQTPTGPAYVWTGNLESMSSSRNYLQATSYASGVLGNVVTFHLDGFHDWASDEEPARYARTFTEFIMDTDDPNRNGFARDVGGGVERAGIPASPEDQWPRRTASTYVNYHYVFASAWDETGEIARVSTQIQERYSDLDTSRLAAGLFVDSYLNSRE
jgi:hypothetical protein